MLLTAPKSRKHRRNGDPRLHVMAHGGMKAGQLLELAQPFPKEPEARPGVSRWEVGL